MLCSGTGLARLVILFYSLTTTATAAHLPTLPTTDRLDRQLITETAVTQYVNKMGRRLMSAIPHGSTRGRIPLLIHVLRTSRLQGMAAPSDPRITITRGMLNVMQNEAELACVLSHEIAHKVHHGKWALRPPLAVSAATTLMTQIYMTRQRERAADYYGVQLCFTAGYNPWALVHFLERLARMMPHATVSPWASLFMTHDDLQQRARQLRTTLWQWRVPQHHGTRQVVRFRSIVSVLRSHSTPAKAIELVPGGHDASVAQLRAIQAQLATSEARPESLPVESFLGIMRTLSQIYGRHDLPHRRSVSSPHTAQFMKERVSQDSPLWPSEEMERVGSELLIQLGRMGVGAIPVIGDAIDLFEFLTGREFGTGRLLSGGERLLTVAALVIGSGAAWRAMAGELDATLHSAELAMQVKRRDLLSAEQALTHASRLFENSRHWGIESAEALNQQMRRRGLQPAYHPDSRILYRETQIDEQYYRAYNDNMVGSWLMDVDPRTLTQEEIKSRFGLPQLPSRVARVHVPAGTQLRMSVAGPNAFGPGGGVQIELRDIERAQFDFLETL